MVVVESVLDTNIIPCQVVTNHPSAGGRPVAWKASFERVGDDILLIHNALPKAGELAEIAERFSDKFVSSSVVGDDLKEYADEDARNSDQLLLKSDDSCPDELLFYGLICQSMEGQFITTYLQHVNEHARVNVGSGYTALRYREGGYFKTHVDVTRDHPVLGHRRLSGVYFCNDDFEGGDLVFPRQDLVVKPESGLMVLFPSGFTHPHESTTITKGTKYSIVSWYF